MNRIRSKNFASTNGNKAMEGMMNLFLSCQRCTKLTMKPKQLKCSHIICTKCALRYRTRNLRGGFWKLECSTCYAMEAWRDENGELSGLTDNMLMQQMRNQMETQIDVSIGPQFPAPNLEFRYQKKAAIDRKFHTDIVTTVKQKIEVQEAVDYAEKKMEKCQRQARYVKSYERKIEACKNAMVQKITQATELLIANVMEERGRLLAKLNDMFEEEIRPVIQARANIKKQSESLETLTRCCDVASRMIKHGGAPIDTVNFKQIVHKNMEEVRKYSLPHDMRRKFKTNVSVTCNADAYGDLVRDFVGINWKPQLESTEIEATPETQNLDQIDSIYPEQPIYDFPPESENQNGADLHGELCGDILYDEIPAEFQNVCCQGPEHPYLDPSVDNTDDLPSPPIPPKRDHLRSEVVGQMAEELAAQVQEFEKQRATAINADSDWETSSKDSFSNVTDDESTESPTLELKGPPIVPRTSKVTSAESGLDTLRRYLSRKHSKVSKKDTDSGNSNQSSSDLANDISPKQVRRNMFRSFSASSTELHSSKLLFSIGKLRKVGLKEAFSQPPQISTDKIGRIWILDAATYTVQAHDGMRGNLISSFKMVLNGVRLKSRGIATMGDGKKIATSCGKYVIVWNTDGNFLRKYGPRCDIGKLSGLTSDQAGNLILADVDNVQIAFEDTAVKITDICSQKAGKQSWPGSITINSHNQIITPDYNDHCVKIFTKEGQLVNKFGGFGTEKGRMRYPSAVAVDKKDRIYVADECNCRITIFSADGSVCFGEALTREDGIKFPHSISVLTNGSIVVSDDSKLVKIYKGLYF